MDNELKNTLAEQVGHLVLQVIEQQHQLKQQQEAYVKLREDHAQALARVHELEVEASGITRVGDDFSTEDGEDADR